jgi:Na+/serine symporter
VILDSFITFAFVQLIGIIAGVIAQRGVGESWISRRVVGVASVLFIAAIVGAALVVWGWKTVRL